MRLTRLFKQTALMAALPNARGCGLSASVGRPGTGQAALAAGLGLAGALALTGASVLALALAVTATTLALAALAHRKIGGQTAIDLTKECAADAAAVIAIGSCASWGGMPSIMPSNGDPNPTGASGVAAVLGNRW